MNHIGNYRLVGASDNIRKRAELPDSYFGRLNQAGIDINTYWSMNMLITPSNSTLLGQAFTALNLATSNDVEISGEAIQRKIERHLYQLGCAINKLRNKQGTGHGRPYLPSVSVDLARTATECMGIIAEYLLTKL